MATRRALLAGAAASLAAPAVSAPSDPDHELIRLCREYVRIDGISEHVSDQQEALAQPLSAADDAEWSRLDDIACQANAQLGRLENAIAGLPARTPAGTRAKADAALCYLRYLRDQDGDIAHSLARDMLA